MKDATFAEESGLIVFQEPFKIVLQDHGSDAVCLGVDLMELSLV
jgi:hypothetical protein